MKHALWLKSGYSLDMQESLDHAVAAQEAGWDGIFLSDSIWEGYSDPFTTLAAIATKTERITLGTWVTPVPHRVPWWLAHTLACLDQLAGGRLMLGAGLGAGPEYEMFGSPYDLTELGRKYDEALEIITGLWRGEPYSFQGEFFEIRGAKLPIRPAQQPRIPILLACWWPNKRPFRRAAQWDGIMPFWPALLRDGAGPQGEQAPGSVEDQLRDLVDYYLEFADQPGEIFLPDRPLEGYRALCEEIGATWVMSMDVDSIKQVRQGPPR